MAAFCSWVLTSINSQMWRISSVCLKFSIPANGLDGLCVQILSFEGEVRVVMEATVRTIFLSHCICTKQGFLFV